MKPALIITPCIIVTGHFHYFTIRHDNVLYISMICRFLLAYFCNVHNHWLIHLWIIRNCSSSGLILYEAFCSNPPGIFKFSSVMFGYRSFAVSPALVFIFALPQVNEPKNVSNIFRSEFFQSQNEFSNLCPSWLKWGIHEIVPVKDLIKCLIPRKF